MLNWKDFRPLFMERTKLDSDGWDLSLGRIAFWACFTTAVYFWMWKGVDIQPSHMQMLYITVTYNLAKKMSLFKDGMNSLIAAKTAPKVQDTETYGEEPAPKIRE